MAKITTSLICTVLNEERTISLLLESVLQQTKKPDEMVITDGGSSDSTQVLIRRYKNVFSKADIMLKLLIKKGNRSVGRNYALSQAKGTFIACTDAGCVLDKKWFYSLWKARKRADVIAGYYKGLPKTRFEQALIPYVLVMPDKLNPKHFLPASRSMACAKETWKMLGGFPEQFNHNEDYVLAKKMERLRVPITFEKNAIVYWIPPSSWKEAYSMFYRFALGDSEAGIFRPKVLILFARYLLAGMAGIFFLVTKNPLFLAILLFGFIAYYLWAIAKNYRYARESFYYLPFLQFLSDFAVISGTITGRI